MDPGEWQGGWLGQGRAAGCWASWGGWVGWVGGAAAARGCEGVGPSTLLPANPTRTTITPSLGHSHFMSTVVTWVSVAAGM